MPAIMTAEVGLVTGRCTQVASGSLGQMYLVLTVTVMELAVNRITPETAYRYDGPFAWFSTVPVWPAYVPVVIFTGSPRLRIHCMVGALGKVHAGGVEGVVIGGSSSRSDGLPNILAR